MKAKQRDKDSLLNKFPDFRIIIETTGSTNYQGTEYNGSIISSFKEIAFVCEKKNFIYVIPWSDINSISTKKTFITNNINLTYDNSSKNLTFKFTNVESVIAIEVLSQAINEHKMALKVQEDLLNSKEKELKDLQLHKESEFQLTHHDIASIKPNNLEKYDLINDEAETTDNIVQDSFIVVGLNYENRHKKLKKMINSMKKNEEFFFLYEDLRGKELLDELEFGGVIFEIDNYEKVPGIYLEKEPNNMYDSNAIKVMVSNDYGSFNVGYVPSENAKYLNDYFNNIVSCTAYIYGGKYKEFDYIEERIVTKEKNYGLKLEISYYK